MRWVRPVMFVTGIQHAPSALIVFKSSHHDNHQTQGLPLIPIHPIKPNKELEDSTHEYLYAAHQKIHPRSVKGFFARWRWALVILTQLFFYGLPWLEWGQRQAVLFDLAARRFYIFGLVLYPQDFIYLTGLLIVCALSLFLFTAVAGRLWCGFACPQTVYSEIFMWVERLIEGDRGARIKLDEEPMSMHKAGKKLLKQLVWVVIALFTGYTFVGYFTPIKALSHELMQWGLGPWEMFWILFYGFATYGNAGHMREQVCLYMCPYARFQSAMFDRDTLIVTYDESRGEPKGRRSRHDDAQAKGLGHCVDCTLCVQVCPTGIDIRDGLQYQCISCGACADVCDTVMDKVGYPKGLVRFTTENALLNRLTKMQMWESVLRPRVVIYACLLGTLVLLIGISLALRTPFKMDVVRDRGALARFTDHESLENVYRLQIMNASESTMTFRLSVTGLPDIYLHSNPEVSVPPTQSSWVAVQVDVPYPNKDLETGSHRIWFELADENTNTSIKERSVFIVPR